MTPEGEGRAGKAARQTSKPHMQDIVYFENQGTDKIGQVHTMDTTEVMTDV